MSGRAKSKIDVEALRRSEAKRAAELARRAKQAKPPSKPQGAKKHG